MLKRFLPFCLVLILFSCKKETDNFTTVPASDYYPMQVGQYTDYNLDSTVFLNFGVVRDTIYYQAREIVEDSLLDNMGRRSFRIVRYLRRNSNEDWHASMVYFATPSKNSVEVVENNLRYVKLVSPVRQDYSWKGNEHIDTYSTDLNLNYMDDWDYVYDSVGVPLTIGDLSFENTIKVFEREEFLGQDPTIPGTQYAEETHAFEKYAKGVGLISREFLHWEYQGPQPGRGAYFEGFGIKMIITGFGKN